MYVYISYVCVWAGEEHHQREPPAAADVCWHMLTYVQVKRIINEPTAAALAFGVIDSNTGTAELWTKACRSTNYTADELIHVSTN